MGDYVFQGQLKLEPVMGNPRDCLVLESYVFVDQCGDIWECKPGDRINGASIPRVFWWLIGSPYAGNYRWATALHDSAYIHKKFPRWKCDRMMLRVMKIHGVKRWRRRLMYRMVVLFGAHVYDHEDQ